MKLKKAQFSIFIILAVIVITGFTLLISTSFDNKKSDVEEDQDVALFGSDKEFLSIKDKFDSCLKRGLKKAVIVSGMKGGFIYDYGENYSPMAISSVFYDEEFVSALGLNYNFLTSGALYYYNFDINEVDPFDMNGRELILDGSLAYNYKNYQHSIKDDYETFIFNEFLECAELDKLEDEGFILKYENFSAKIQNVLSNKKIRTQTRFGKNDERVVAILPDKKYDGKIVETYQGYNIVEFNENFLDGLTIDLREISLINLNTSSKVEVFFNSETIEATLFFPSTISTNKTDKIFSYKKGQVSENNRIVRLNEFAKKIMHKKQFNKSYDLSTVSNIDSFLNQDPYFKTQDLSKIDFQVTKIKDLPEEKIYLYSIVDEYSKVYGKPFIFNFAYKNDAPIVNLQKFRDDGIELEGESPVFFVATNIDTKINLSPYIIEKQFGDNVVYNPKNGFRFVPDSQNLGNRQFSINSKGNVVFRTATEDRFTVPVQVTDGETTRTFYVIFSSGVSNNDQNDNSVNCFSFVNPERQFFPINAEYENKIFEQDIGTWTNTWAYYLQPNLVRGPQYPGPYLEFSNANPTLIFRSSCLGDASQVQAQVSVNGNPIGTFSGAGGDISIPINVNDILGTSSYGRYDVNKLVEVLPVNLGGTPMISTPFTINLIPTQCLGPKLTEDRKKYLMNANVDSECCTLPPIATMPTGSNLVNTINDATKKPIDVDMWFYIDYDPASQLQDTFLWDPAYPVSNPTSLYRGHVTSTCKGEMPLKENNLEPISGGATTIGTLEQVISGINVLNLEDPTVIPFYDRSYIPNQHPMGVDVHIMASMCEFTYIFNSSDYMEFNLRIPLTPPVNMIYKGVSVRVPQPITPFVNHLLNDTEIADYGPTIATLEADEQALVNSIFGQVPTVYALCNFPDVYYGSPDGLNNVPSNWTLGTTGTSIIPKSVYSSKGYCQRGFSNVCAGRNPSPTVTSQGDSVSTCTNKYWSPVNNFYTMPGDTSWQCGSGSYTITCIGTPADPGDPTATPPIPPTPAVPDASGTQYYNKFCDGSATNHCPDTNRVLTSVYCPPGTSYP